jgi:hypothetical protein
MTQMIQQETAVADKKVENPEHLTERLIFPVSPGMAEEIKDFWHDQRLNSKSEAIRQLIEDGLDKWRKTKRKR